MGRRRRPAGAGLGLLAVVVVVAFLVLRPRAPNPVPPVPSPPPSTSVNSPIATADAESAPPATTDPSPSQTAEPADAVDEDGTFRLEIAIPRTIYLTTEAIQPRARLTYLGPQNAIEYGHASPATYFMIRQLDGSAQMTGGADDVCELTTLRRDEPAIVAFAKGGQIGLGFDRAWFEDPVLRLPAGAWRITVSFEGSVPGCEIGGDTHRLQAFGDIAVR